MNWYKLFYWLTVADNAKVMFIVFMSIFTIISLVSTICFLSCTGDDRDSGRKWMFWSYPFMILFWSLYVFTPDRKDALLIVAGGGTMEFLTTDSTAKQIPHELSNFVVTELRNMGEEAKVELQVMTQKDKILQEAKNMTSDQLLQRMKVDTSFAKIILNQ